MAAASLRVGVVSFALVATLSLLVVGACSSTSKNGDGAVTGLGSGGGAGSAGGVGGVGGSIGGGGGRGGRGGRGGSQGGGAGSTGSAGAGGGCGAGFPVGSTRPAGDGCNFCNCIAPGAWVCSTAACPIGGSGGGGAVGGSGAAAGAGGAAGRGGSGAGGAGSGGTSGAGGRGGAGAAGSGGQGVLCGGARCQPGDTCCYDSMGNGTCATPPAVCIGVPATCNNGQACAAGLYCDITSPRRCLASAVGGVCIERPSACTRIYQPVCGCDGATYGNDCERRRAHAQLDHEGACSGSDAGSG